LAGASSRGLVECVWCVPGSGGPQQGLQNPTLMHILKLSDRSELPWPTAPRSVYGLPRSQRSMSPVILCCKSLQNSRWMVQDRARTGLFDTQNAIAISVVMALMSLTFDVPMRRIHKVPTVCSNVSDTSAITAHCHLIAEPPF